MQQFLLVGDDDFGAAMIAGETSDWKIPMEQMKRSSHLPLLRPACVQLVTAIQRG
jgi:hypothetical protein